MLSHRIHSEDTVQVLFFITVHGAAEEKVSTANGPVRFVDWLARERDRRTDGLRTEIVVSKTGEVALAAVAR